MGGYLLVCFLDGVDGRGFDEIVVSGVLLFFTCAFCFVLVLCPVGSPCIIVAVQKDVVRIPLYLSNVTTIVEIM